jgi:hypothetical protein
MIVAGGSAMSDASWSFAQRKRALIVAVGVVAGCGACATPDKTADADAYAPRVYRTGSNLPVKDYRAANIEVAPPDVVNPANRLPMGTNRPPGG